MTFQKIQNKLKASITHQESEERSNKTPNNRKETEEDDAYFNVNGDKIQNLTSLGFHLYDSKENTPKSANHQLKMLYGQQSTMVIGPKSNSNAGRPKCFSETISTQFKQRIS